MEKPMSETKKFTAEEVKQLITANGGDAKAFTIVPNNDLFFALLKDDFATVLPTPNVRSMDELENIILTLVDKDGVTQAHTLAKHLVDGLWARARSIEYSRQTKAARQEQLKAAAQLENRKKYDKLLADNPKIAEDTENLLSLQRSYGIIDQGTYELLLGQYRSLVAAAKRAADAVMASGQGQGAAQQGQKQPKVA